jgi:hypothetical protein
MTAASEVSPLEERMAMLGFNLFVDGNNAEAVLWTAIGVAFAAAALTRRGAARKKCLIAAVVFVLFGASDLVEAHTGAWWRPWWLFAWKAACVVAMFVLYLDHRRARRAAQHVENVASTAKDRGDS